MTDLAGLLERVKAATGPTRELDGDLFLDLGVYPIESQSRWESPPSAPIREWASRQALPYTASIDAALALVEKMLPGAVWHVMTDYGDLNRAKIGQEGNPRASIYRSDDRQLFSQADAITPALAILAVLLTALIARETAHD